MRLSNYVPFIAFNNIRFSGVSSDSRSLSRVSVLDPRIRLFRPWNPPLGFLTWNIDGSALGKPGAAGAEGVLRNHLGSILCIFSMNIGIQDSNYFDFIAMEATLVIQYNSAWANFPTIIDSESSNAISWALNSSFYPWKYRQVWNQIQNLINGNGGMLISFQKILRDYNCVADNLARRGVAMVGNDISWLR